jgi:DNA polymerase-3 subunit delta'
VSASLVRPLGQGAVFARAVRQARSLTLHHGLLVTGAPGSGSSTALCWLTAALQCTGADAAAPCGVCLPCRKVSAGNHPDVHLLTVPEEKKDIPVDAVRELQGELQRTVREGRARVLQIDPADLLNDSGQNALLKTLEEPLPGTFLLLAAALPDKLLPTVRSRVVRLRLLGLSPGELRKELSARLPAAAVHFDRAIRLAGGSLGQALELCTERAVQIHDLVLALLADTERLRAVATARAVLAGAADRDGALRQARSFLRMLRTELRYHLRERLESGADAAYAQRAADRWTALLDSTLTAEEDLALGIPGEQALAGCLLQMQL